MQQLRVLLSMCNTYYNIFYMLKCVTVYYSVLQHITVYYMHAVYYTIEKCIT